jgi:hypothetical protein
MVRQNEDNPFFGVSILFLCSVFFFSFSSFSLHVSSNAFVTKEVPFFSFYYLCFLFDLIHQK